MKHRELRLWANEEYPYGKTNHIDCEWKTKYKVFIQKISELVKQNLVVILHYNDKYLDGKKPLIGVVRKNYVILFTRDCMDLMNEIFLDREFASSTIGAQLQQADLIVHSNSYNERRVSFSYTGCDGKTWGKVGWAIDFATIGLENPIVIDYQI